MSLISKGFVEIGLVPGKLRRHMRLFIYVYLSLRMAAIQKQMQVKCKTEIICLLTPSPRRSKWSPQQDYIVENTENLEASHSK